MREVPIDFEYNRTKEPVMRLVCCSLEDNDKTYNYWLIDDRKPLIDHLNKLIKENVLFISFNAVAEARCFRQLGIDPLTANWYDLALEYRFLANENDDVLYGNHVCNGRFKSTKKKPYGQDGDDFEDDEEEEEGLQKSHAKPDFSLADAIFHFLETKIDMVEKDASRDIILADKPFTEDEKTRIMTYCANDIKYLTRIKKSILEGLMFHISNFDYGSYFKFALKRGEYAARTAIMEDIGYPVNVEQCYTFALNVDYAIRELQRDIFEQFELSIRPFRRNADGSYTKNIGAIRNWIKSQNLKGWTLTKGKQLSYSKKAFEKFFTFQHDYPRGDFAAQYLRFLKTESALKGFYLIGKKKDSFFKYLGSDGRVRGWLNPYGAKTGRSQPKSISFIFLKPAWLRSLVQPKEGKYIVGIDYSSEEFLLSGLTPLICDLKMIDAYKSGDVYLSFAKMANAAPQEATKSTHKKIRDLFKSTVLGLSYNIGKEALARKLTQDTGTPVTVIQAEKQIDKFKAVFKQFAKWNELNKKEYIRKRFQELPDGWRMFGDCDNWRTVNNFKIQGIAACVMRRAVELCQDAGITILFTLHDALYAEFDDSNIHLIDTMFECMQQAVIDLYPEEKKQYAALMRMEGEIWGPTLDKGTFVTPKGNKLESDTIHIDPRAKNDYNQFSKYFFELYDPAYRDL